MTDTAQKKGWKEILEGRCGIVVPVEWGYFSYDNKEDGEKLYELMEQHGYFKSKQQEEK